MIEGNDSISATAKSSAPWLALLSLVVIAGLAIDDEVIRQDALRTVLLLTAAAEAMAGFTYVFRARHMAERAGRPYAAAYHGVMQDFGFYNLAMSVLLGLCAMNLARTRIVLCTAIGLYAVHAITHGLRYLGYYYGGETGIPTRARALELRDALQLAVALAGMLVFYPGAGR